MSSYSEAVGGNGKKSDYELKEEARSILPQVQDLVFDIEKKGYPDYVVKAAKLLVKSVAECEAAKVDKEYSDDDIKDMSADDYKSKVLSKKVKVIKVEDEEVED